MPEETRPEKPERGAGTLRRPRRWPAVLVNLVLAAVLGTAALLIWMTDRPIAAPAYLRDRVETRLAEALPELGVVFGEMVVTVHQGWRPKVAFRDVEFRTPAEEGMLSVSELEATLAMRPLLRGQVQLQTVSVAGIFATLRRDTDGTFDLFATGDTSGAMRQASTLAELVEQLDDLFLSPDMAALTELDADAVTLRYEDARVGRAWTIDGARLQVTREDDDLSVRGDLAVLSGGADVTVMAASYASRLGDAAAEFGISVQDAPASDLAVLTPTLGWLAGLRAPISGNLRGGIQSSGALAPINAVLQMGEGVLQPTPQTRPIPFDAAQTYFTFDPASSTLVFDQLSLDSPWLKGQLEGNAVLSGVETGRLDELIGQFRLIELEVNPPGFFEEPLLLDGAEVDFRLRPDPFELELGQLRVADQGQSALLDGALRAAPDGWDLAVDGFMGQVSRDRLLALWPQGVGGKTRTWLSQNLLAAHLSQVQFALRSEPNHKPDVHFSFNFDDTQARFMKSMPTIDKARGVASLIRNRFVLLVEQGEVQAPEGGRLDISGSSFIVPDVAVKDGAPAVLRLRTDSTITAALSVLDRDPLNVMSRAGQPVSVADGRAELDIQIALPLRKGMQMSEVQFGATGQLRNVVSTALVPDRRITAPELSLNVSNTALEIAGAGQFDGIPASVVWRQALGEAANGTSQLTGAVELSADAANILNLGLPDGAISGVGQGALQLDLAAGQPPRFRLSSKLAGLGLRIPELGWSLSRERTGDLTVAGVLGDSPAIDLIELTAPGLSATGAVSLNPEGGLARASFTRVRLGGWLDAPVTLVGRGAGQPPAVNVTGGDLDLRQASFISGSGGGRSSSSGPVSLALQSLRITDTIALTDFKGDFNLRGGLQGRFSGSVNGQAGVTGQVEPQGARSAFRIRSNDAGRVFAAAGLLKLARGGEMSLTLQPVGTAGAFNGSLSIANTRVKDAPAIAALFNALSVVGILEQMSGQGLHFGEVEAAFRLTPDKVTLTQASAIGASIGMSMNGVYDVNSSVMDMSGVFSPIYLINGVGSVLTRKGEGVIGFNFRLTGPAEKPKVQVNPLSALTPGLFREIFRRPPPQVVLEPGEEPGAAPRVQQSDVTRRTKRVEEDQLER